MSAALADPAQANIAAVASPEIESSFFIARTPQLKPPVAPNVTASPGRKRHRSDVIKSDESKSVHERSRRNAQESAASVAFAPRCGAHVTPVCVTRHNPLGTLRNLDEPHARDRATSGVRRSRRGHAS